MNILDVLLNFTLHLKVVHAIPGRIRLHIPIAKKVPKEWQVESISEEMVALIDGVKKVDFSYVTCNALIEYDSSITNEKQILRSIKDLAHIGLKHKKEFIEYKPEDRDLAIKKFINFVKKERGG